MDLAPFAAPPAESKNDLAPGPEQQQLDTPKTQDPSPMKRRERKSNNHRPPGMRTSNCPSNPSNRPISRSSNRAHLLLQLHRRGQDPLPCKLLPGIARSPCRSNAIKAIRRPREPDMRLASPSLHSRLTDKEWCYRAKSSGHQALRHWIKRRSPPSNAHSHFRRRRRTCRAKPSNSRSL